MSSTKQKTNLNGKTKSLRGQQNYGHFFFCCYCKECITSKPSHNSIIKTVKGYSFFLKNDNDKEIKKY